MIAGGLAAVGVGLIVYGEVKAFMNPDTAGDWSDLFVGLGIEMAKVGLSAVLGAAGVALLVGAGVFTGAPLFFIIALGAGISIAVSAIIDELDEMHGIKKSAQKSINSINIPPIDRNGGAIIWR